MAKGHSRPRTLNPFLRLETPSEKQAYQRHALGKNQGSSARRARAVGAQWRGSPALAQRAYGCLSVRSRGSFAAEFLGDCSGLVGRGARVGVGPVPFQTSFEHFSFAIVPRHYVMFFFFTIPTYLNIGCHTILLSTKKAAPLSLATLLWESGTRRGSRDRPGNRC